MRDLDDIAATIEGAADQLDRYPKRSAFVANALRNLAAGIVERRRPEDDRDGWHR